MPGRNAFLTFRESLCLNIKKEKISQNQSLPKKSLGPDRARPERPGAAPELLRYHIIPGALYRCRRRICRPGLPINGDWELSISMAQSATNSAAIMDNHHGRLLDWELIIDVTPCNVNQPRWTKRQSPPIDFTPLRLHTAVAVGSSIFINGGYSATCRLDDMWRFGFDTNTWTDLTTPVLMIVIVIDTFHCTMGKHLYLVHGVSWPMVA